MAVFKNKNTGITLETHNETVIEQLIKSVDYEEVKPEKDKKSKGEKNKK